MVGTRSRALQVAKSRACGARLHQRRVPPSSFSSSLSSSGRRRRAGIVSSWGWRSRSSCGPGSRRLCPRHQNTDPGAAEKLDSSLLASCSCDFSPKPPQPVRSQTVLLILPPPPPPCPCLPPFCPLSPPLPRPPRFPLHLRWPPSSWRNAVWRFLAGFQSLLMISPVLGLPKIRDVTWQSCPEWSVCAALKKLDLGEDPILGLVWSLALT